MRNCLLQNWRMPVAKQPRQLLSAFAILCSLLICTSGLQAQLSIRLLPDSAVRKGELPWHTHFTTTATNGQFNPGFTNTAWWLTTTVYNTDSVVQQYKLVLNNPHINLLKYYQNGDTTPLHITGDWLPFAQRPFQDRDFVFPLQILPHDSIPILLLVDKANESLQLHAELYSNEAFEQMRHLQNLLMGAGLGWLLLIVLLSVFLGISLSDKAALIYALYVLFTMAWIVSNWGIGFQYLWPELTDFPSKARPVFLLLCTASFLATLPQFFPPFSGRKWLVKSIHISIGVQVTLAVVLLFSNYQQLPSVIKVPFLQVCSVCSIISVVLCVLYLWRQWRNNAPLVGYYFTGISFLLFVTLLLNLHQFGISAAPNEFLNMYGSSLGLIGESTILGLGFAHRANLHRKQKEQLALQLLEQEKQLAEKIIAVEAEERSRIGRDLHDTVGSMLATINMRLNKLIHQEKLPEEATELQALIATTMQETRSISHNLVPPHLAGIGLEQVMLNHINSINQQAGLQVQFDYAVATQLPESFQLLVYRICHELLHNILKHADASEANLSIAEDSGAIQIIAEDNGKGFSNSTASKGIGLKNIDNRIAYLKGTLHIDSNTSGTTIVITLPI